MFSSCGAPLHCVLMASKPQLDGRCKDGEKRSLKPSDIRNCCSDSISCSYCWRIQDHSHLEVDGG